MDVRAQLGEAFAGIHRDMTVDQFDAAVGLLRDVRIMGDHEDGVAGSVQLTEQAEDNLFVGFIEIAGGFIGEDQFWLID